MQADLARATEESEKRWATFGLGAADPPGGHLVATMADLEAVATDLLASQHGWYGSARAQHTAAVPRGQRGGQDAAITSTTTVDTRLKGLADVTVAGGQEAIIVMVDVEPTSTVNRGTRAGRMQTYLVETMLTDTPGSLHAAVAAKLGHPTELLELSLDGVVLDSDDGSSRQTVQLADLGIISGTTLAAALR